MILIQNPNPSRTLYVNRHSPLRKRELTLSLNTLSNLNPIQITLATLVTLCSSVLRRNQSWRKTRKLKIISHWVLEVREIIKESKALEHHQGILQMTQTDRNSSSRTKLMIHSNKHRNIDLAQTSNLIIKRQLVIIIILVDSRI